ncbi:hypothetical protein TWF694_002866 [Orbilia ellipsospora]|uniref:Tail specific protease domain-containing protein n=1 Tax=Orbilia ellipsospora TaxID=2528407 RepID=A0AAV9WZV7_9PEZI
MHILAAFGLLSAAKLAAAGIVPRADVTVASTYRNYYPPSNYNNYNYTTTKSSSTTPAVYTDTHVYTDTRVYTNTQVYYTNTKTYTKYPTTRYYNTTATGVYTYKPTPEPSVTHYTPKPGEFTTACACISASYSSALASYSANPDPDAAYPTLVPILAREGWDCLYSVPINVELTLTFIKEVKKYIQFQSTIEFLKNPPASSLQEPIDLIGSIDALAQRVQSGDIAHHVKFEIEFTKLLQRCHDGHFNYAFNSGNLIFFTGPFTIVSVSTDAVEKPLVYVETDLLEFGLADTAHITRIDGYEVEAWLAEFSDFGNSQSPDARYNSIFSNRDPGSDGAFFDLWGWYPGKNYIDVTFSNQSTYQYPYGAFAAWSDTLNWTGINDGSDFYKKAVLNADYITVQASDLAPTATSTGTAAGSTYTGGANANAHHFHDSKASTVKRDLNKRGSQVKRASPSPSPSQVQLVYFNQPFMRHKVGPFVQDLNAIIGGYFLNDTVETAVLDISSFEAANDNADYQNAGFQAALYAFFDEVRRRGTKRLIIDVRGNGGGLINLGFELYKQLFPAAPANSYYRFRAHPGAQIFASGTETIASQSATDRLLNLIEKDAPDFPDDEVSRVVDRLLNGGFSRQTELDVKGNKPEDLATYIGPYNLTDGPVNDLVSLLVKTNLNINLGGTPVSGFGALSNFTKSPQPFQIPDILFLSDGTCASTCTIFAELLKREQPGISSVVMGGRPNDGPSPDVGGVHGSRVLAYKDLLQDTIDVVNYAAPATTELQEYYLANLPLPLPFSAGFANINFRDAIRPEDKTQTPLQFKLEPADCRLYFNHLMFLDSIYLWGELAEFKWGTKSNFTQCAVGSLEKGKGSTGEVPPDPETLNVANWIMNAWNA